MKPTHAVAALLVVGSLAALLVARPWDGTDVEPMPHDLSSGPVVVDSELVSSPEFAHLDRRAEARGDGTPVRVEFDPQIAWMVGLVEVAVRGPSDVAPFRSPRTDSPPLEFELEASDLTPYLDDFARAEVRLRVHRDVAPTIVWKDVRAGTDGARVVTIESGDLGVAVAGTLVPAGTDPRVELRCALPADGSVDAWGEPTGPKWIPSTTLVGSDGRFAVFAEEGDDVVELEAVLLGRRVSPTHTLRLGARDAVLRLDAGVVVVEVGRHVGVDLGDVAIVVSPADVRSHGGPVRLAQAAADVERNPNRTSSLAFAVAGTADVALCRTDDDGGEIEGSSRSVGSVHVPIGAVVHFGADGPFDVLADPNVASIELPHPAPYGLRARWADDESATVFTTRAPNLCAPRFVAAATGVLLSPPVAEMREAVATAAAKDALGLDQPRVASFLLERPGVELVVSAPGRRTVRVLPVGGRTVAMPPMVPIEPARIEYVWSDGAPHDASTVVGIGVSPGPDFAVLGHEVLEWPVPEEGADASICAYALRRFEQGCTLERLPVIRVACDGREPAPFVPSESPRLTFEPGRSYRVVLGPE
ncbi:MAG: hypothetical protein R3F34_04195 [Planctomycetota bacterium]